MSRLNLTLFGTPRIDIDGQAVHIARRKATALLVYLAVTGVRHNRDSLATLLWPEKSQSSARAELRRGLYFINKALGNRWLQTDLETAGLNPELKDSLSAALWLDVAVFQQQLKACENHEHSATEIYPDCIPHLEAAVDLYTDHFMAGFSLPDCPAYDEWQFFQTEGLRGQLASVLLRLSSFYTSASRQDFETAIRYARRWLTLDPLHEPAHQQLMKLYALSGQKAAASRQYELLKHALEADLSVTPSEETVELLDRIMGGEFLTGAGASRKAAKREQKPTHNLPRQLTSFIGRETEIRQVISSLKQAPEVTVIGHGGIGKTRLAIEVSRAVLDRFSNGVWLVDLAPLSDPEKVPQSAARAVDIPVDTGAQALEALLGYLRPRQMLLVLDNCEHLIEACAQLAEAILTECPQVKILATSREILGITGESVYYLPSLSVPHPEDIPAFDQIRQFEAIELFASRASAVQSQFSLEAHNASDVARVCAQLDGIPLAIELAAAWVRTLPVDQISRRLSENIDFLRGSSRSALPRHQTLRACLDWSYDLLPLDEQDLLQVLAVFAGGWTLEAAEAVCAGCCDSQFEVLEILDQLAAKSLVIVEHHPKIETRYHLLEPVRQYARGKLYDSGDMESVRDRHLAYYQYLAEQAKPHLRAHRQIEWLRRLERELGNIRVALDWAYSEDGPMQRVEAGLRIAADLLWFWQCRCRHIEGIQWSKRLLDLEQQRRGNQQLSRSMCLARAWALTNMVALTGHVLATLDDRSYNFPAMLDESLALFNQMDETGKRGLVITNFWRVSIFPDKLDDQFGQLESLFTEFETLGDKLYMATCLLFQGDYDHPEKHYQKAISLCEEIGDREMIPFLWASLGNVAYLQGEPEKAKTYVVEAVNILKDVENDLLASAFKGYEELGHLSWRMGEYCQAEKYYQSVINIAKNQHLYIRSEIFLCCIAMSQGDYHKARVQLNNIYLSLRGRREFGRIWIFPFVVRILAELESWTGNYAQADKWLTELKEIDATVNIDRMNLHRNYLYLVLAKVAISKMKWYVAAEHVRSALNIQIQTPVWSDGLYEHKYAAVTLAGVLASALGKPKKAAWLLGTADRSYRLHRLTFPLFRRQLIEQTIEVARNALDEESFTTAWEAGRAMDLNEALAYAVEVMEQIQFSSRLDSGTANDPG